MENQNESTKELMRQRGYKSTETGALVRIIEGGTVVQPCIGCGKEFPIIPTEGYPVSTERAQELLAEITHGPPYHCGNPNNAACLKPT